MTVWAPEPPSEARSLEDRPRFDKACAPLPQTQTLIRKYRKPRCDGKFTLADRPIDTPPFSGWRLSAPPRMKRKRPLRIGRGAVSAPARGLDPKPVPGTKLTFALRRYRVPVEEVEAGRPRSAALSPAWTMAAALRDQRVAHRRGRLELSNDALAAAVRPGTAASTSHGQLPDQDGKVALECLDRRVQRVRHRDVLGARAVTVGACPLSAADRLVVGPVGAGERHVVHRSLAVRSNRRELGERLEDEVGDPARGLDVPADDRRRGLRIEQRSARGAYGHRAPGSRRGRRIRIAGDAHGVEAGGLRHRQGAVEVPRDLLGAAVEVELEGFPAYSRPQPQGDVAVASLEHIPGGALSVGHRGQRGAGAPLRVIEDLSRRDSQELDPVALGELSHPPDSGEVRGALGAEIG